MQKLQNSTLAKIHQAILETSSESEAAESLGVCKQTLLAYLNLQQPLTYSYLKNNSINALKAIYGNSYNQCLPAKKLEEIPLSKIHEAVLLYPQDNYAAQHLGVTRNRLATYLSRYSLSCDKLRQYSIEDAQIKYGNGYSLPLSGINIKLAEQAFSKIYKAVRSSKSFSHAAEILGVGRQELAAYLKDRCIFNQRLSYDYLKGLTSSVLRAKLGNQFDKPLPLSNPKNIADHRFAEIHKIIRESARETDAAANLGVTVATLKRYLGRYVHNGTTMSYSLLRKYPIPSLQVYYGAQYYQPLPKIIAISPRDYSFAYIHQVIQQSSSLKETAGKLMVHPKTLNRQLALHGWTYEDLKNLSDEDLKKYYGEQYYQALPKITVRLDNYKFEYIHQTIIESHNYTEAARKLGVRLETLKRYLQRFHLNGIELHCDLIRLYPEETRQAQPKLPLPDIRIDIKKRTLAEIHHVILTSQNETLAAHTLDVDLNALREYIGRYLYDNNKILSYAFLRKLSVDEMRTQLDQSYYQPLPEIHHELRDYSLAEIHQIVLIAENDEQAALVFGVHEPELASFLSQLHYNEQPLSCILLRQCSPDEMLAHYGNHYMLPLNNNDTLQKDNMEKNDIWRHEHKRPSGYAPDFFSPDPKRTKYMPAMNNQETSDDLGTSCMMSF